MIACADSSALVAAALGESRQEAVLDALRQATACVASVLAEIETERAVARAIRERRVAGTRATEVRERQQELVASMSLLELTPPIVLLAKGTFPLEPVRSLDAIHLATALFIAREVGPVTVVALDDRLRANAHALGLPLLP